MLQLLDGPQHSFLSFQVIIAVDQDDHKIVSSGQFSHPFQELDMTGVDSGQSNRK